MKNRGIILGIVSALILVLFLVSFASFILAGTLKVTEEHPFLVDGKWISASELNAGDILQTSDGKKVRITSVEDVVDNEGFEVYNLEASEYSNFVVSSDKLVVHNSDKASVKNSSERNFLFEKSG